VKLKLRESVLVTTAGTIVAQGIIKALKLANSIESNRLQYRIVTTDESAEAAGLYRGDMGYLVPLIRSPDYFDTIIELCQREDIRAVFVGADEELLLMSENQFMIENETHAIVITNPLNVIETCVDKWRTYEFLKANGLPCPESALPDRHEEFLKEFGFPAVVKPREGHGSVHFFLVQNSEETKYAFGAIRKAGWNPMIQEYIRDDGVEFTTGVTVSKEGDSVMSSIAMRRTLKGGQTYKAFIDDYDEVREVAEKVALKLGAKGAINIQGRMDSGELRVFEINPRFSASCPMRATSGVNEPDIVFRNFVMNEKIKVERYRHLVCLRYWNELYVPSETFEQTLLNQQVANNDSFLENYF